MAGQDFKDAAGTGTATGWRGSRHAGGGEEPGAAAAAAVAAAGEGEVGGERRGSHMHMRLASFSWQLLLGKECFLPPSLGARRRGGLVGG